MKFREESGNQVENIGKIVEKLREIANRVINDSKAG